MRTNISTSESLSEAAEGNDDDLRRENYSKLRMSSSSSTESISSEDDKNMETKSAEGESKTTPFEAGDHIIRWSHMAYMYPIQIHGIVLETREDGSITIVDFGLTKASANCDEKAMEQEEKHIHKNTSRRLNVITLTKPKDIRKWKKVNYGGNLFTGGSNPFENWKSWFPAAPPKKESSLKSSLKFPVGVESGRDGQFLEMVTSIQEKEHSPANAKPPRLTHHSKSDTFLSDNHKSLDDATGDHHELVEEPYKEKTLLELYAELKDHGTLKNGTPKSSHAKQHSSVASGALQTNDIKQKKHLFPVHIQQQNPDFLQILEEEFNEMSDSSTSASSSVVDYEDKVSQPEVIQLPHSHSSQTLTTTIPLPPRLSSSDSLQCPSPTQDSSSSSSCPNKLPKSDPKKLVLARVQFLLQSETSPLPPYHVFYSNSECIAVWCKTGKWTTLQTAVFLHSTAVGNAKQMFLAIGGVAAINPLLIPAVAPLGIAYIGAPWLYLGKCKEKWEETTMTLTDKFWSQADPEVFVEVIEQWSGLRLD